MSEPIGRGDLVWVARWPCCGAHLGEVRIVHAVEPEPLLGAQCRDCGADHPTCDPIADLDNARAAPVAWLRKIPPLAELDGAAHAVAEPA